MKKIYISGPYSAPTSQGILDNCVHAVHHATMVARGGGYPIIPHTSFPGADYDTAMAACQRQLVCCDGIYMIPGWENSPGAVTERGWATALGMPVLESLPAVCAWLRSAA